MSLDDIDISEWTEQGGWSAEKAREQSEKQRESYKKAQAQIQKTQKDEKKAKGDSDALFAILARFIQNPYYAELLPSVTELLALGLPARFVLILTAFLYPESSLYMLTALGKKEEIHTLLDIHKNHEFVVFEEKTLHPSLRKWISVWVQYGQIYLIQEESSAILLKKLANIFEEQKTMKILTETLAEFFVFFFRSRNIEMPKSVAISYTNFILSEYRNTIKKAVSARSIKDDGDIMGDVSITAHDLFGIS
jgi:hypothetical protein